MNLSTLAILVSLASPALPPTKPASETMTAATTEQETATATATATAMATATATPEPAAGGCAQVWPACQAAGAVVGALPGAAVGAGLGVAGGLTTVVVAAAERFNGPASSTIGLLGGNVLPFVGICAAGGAALGLAGGSIGGWFIADDIVE